MYVDTKFNSLLTALTNVYKNLSTTAMKMHSYIRCMNAMPPERLVQGEIDGLTSQANLDLIEQIISLQFTLTRSHLKAWSDSSCAVTEDQVRWLGAMAFWTTLSVKQTGYKTVLSWLKEILQTTKCGKLQLSMERIASRHSISKRIRY